PPGAAPTAAPRGTPRPSRPRRASARRGRARETRGRGRGSRPAQRSIGRWRGAGRPVMMVHRTRTANQGESMARIVKAALIQAATEYDKKKDVDKHVKMIAQAAKKGAQVVCLQEVFNGPYFCAEQDSKWYDWAETIPGPTMDRMQEVAKKHNIVLIVPIYEKVHDGVYYNTAGVIDHDGKLLG